MLVYNVPAYRCVLVREESRDISLQTAIGSSAAARELGIKLLGDSPNEQFVSVMLDTKNRVIGFNVATMGTLDASLVHPRETFRAAIIHNASSVIVIHNHPSGVLQPSPEDWAVFRRLEEAGKVVGIDVLDSIIVSHKESLSMREDA